MDKKVLFVVSSNYQMMFASMMSHYMDHEIAYLIVDSQNKDVNELSSKLAGKHKKWFIPALQKSFMGMISQNRRWFKRVNTIVKAFSPSTVVLFKDNDFISGQVIESASTIGASIALVQEGIGIYTPPMRNTKKRLKTIIPHLLGYPRIYHWVQGLNPKITSIAVTDYDMLPEEKKKTKKLIKIPQISPPAKLLIDYANMLPDAPISKLQNQPKSLLFLGQPLSRLGMLELQEEQMFIEKLLVFAKSENLTLIIKPHPFEERNKYAPFKKDVLLLDSEFPAEIIPLFITLLGVVTPYSSAAVNLNSWFDITVLYVYPLLLDNINLDFKLSGQYIRSYIELEESIRKMSGEERLQDFSFINEKCKEEIFREFVSQFI